MKLALLYIYYCVQSYLPGHINVCPNLNALQMKNPYQDAKDPQHLSDSDEGKLSEVILPESKSQYLNFLFQLRSI